MNSEAKLTVTNLVVFANTVVFMVVLGHINNLNRWLP